MPVFDYSFWTPIPTGIYLFYNSGFLIINDSSFSSPYPSIIGVSNYVGRIKDIKLNISGLSHNFPDDIDMMLSGPNGKNLIVMSDVGGGNAISNVDLTIADSASISFPDESLITPGSYKPTDINDGSDVFSSPAGTSSMTQFTGFTGISPNGYWNLYIMDDNTLDAGSLTGWALQITTTL